MQEFDRYFTLEEARADIPTLQAEFVRIQELIAALEAGHLETERIQKLVQSNGHGTVHPDFGPQIGELQSLVHGILDRGIQIKDLKRGLVDFPYARDGETVFLCWLFGEEDIRFWHTIEGGFANRNPLP